MVATFVSTLMLMTCAVQIVDAHVNPEVQFQEDMAQYEMLKNAKKDGYVITIDDIQKYNNMVKTYKKEAVSPWTNWFCYDGCEDLPYFELNTESSITETTGTVVSTNTIR